MTHPSSATRGPRRAVRWSLAGALVSLACVVPVPAAPASPAEQLVILSTTDVKGMTGPCGCSVPKGGLSRRAALADSMRAAYSNVLLVDNGGFFPDDPKRADAAWFLMDMMSFLDMKAVGTSPSELRLGLARLLANVERTGLPMTSANLVDAKSGKPVLPPYVVTTSGDLKVGFFSLMSDTADLGGVRDSLRVLPPVETARTTVAEIEKQGATVIVLLSQLGRTGSEDLVGAVPGIDAVVCGRNVPLLQSGHQIGSTVASYGGEQGHYLSRILLDLGTDHRVTSGQSQCFALTSEVGEKESVAKMVKTFEDGLALKTGAPAKPAASR